MPATEFAQILWALSNDGVLTEGLLTKISESYVQGALPEIFDNLLGPYKDKIPEEYHHDVLFGVVSYWVRYINPIINKQQYELNGEFYYGVNPNVITLPGNRTLAQAFGVGVNPALNMNQDVISMQQDLLFQVFTNEMTKAEAANKLEKFISKYPVKQKTEAEARYEKADLAYYSKSAKAKGMSTFDFDDTLAFTKSGIRLTRPNTTGKSQPGRKAILIAGNAGAGKTTVINQLGLRKQGLKYVNQDIA